MACHLFITELLSEPMLAYYQFDTWEQTSEKFLSKYIYDIFHSRKGILRCCLQNDAILPWNQCLNSLWFRVDISNHRSWATFVQVMAWCLTGTKPSPGTMLTNHKWGPVAFARGQFHRKCSRYILGISLKITNFRLCPHLPGANELTGTRQQFREKSRSLGTNRLFTASPEKGSWTNQDLWWIMGFNSITIQMTGAMKNLLRQSDAYMPQWSIHHWFR